MLSACFAFFDPPWIPLGISVEDHVLEIVGSDSESGVKMGDIQNRMRWNLMEYALVWFCQVFGCSRTRLALIDSGDYRRRRVPLHCFT